MTGKKGIPGEVSELRKRAEMKARQSPENLNAMTPEETQCLIHELRVHQIELEMQNEELRRVQTELDTARERYFDLYELAPVGYCTISEQGLILEANLTAATLLGVPRGALVKQLLTRFILKEDQDIHYLHRKQLFEDGEPQTWDLRMLKNDGTIFWGHLVAAAAQATYGSPVCLIAISDITKRKQVEEALRNSEARIHTLIQTIPDLIWLKDTDGLYLTCNTMFERFFGAREADIVGKTDYDFVGRELADHFREHDLNAMTEGKPTSKEEWITFADDGHRVFLDTIKTPTYDSGGTLIGVLGIGRDITKRKKDEEEKAILELQLRESQKMDAVGQLAAGIAHDFNNILSVVTGYSHMLLENTGVKAPERAQIEEISRAGERASSLTSQLLVFSRHKPVETRIIDLDAIVSDMEKMLSRLIRKDIVLTRNIGPALWRIKADPGNIEQVIMNLVINASDAMPNGGTLTVETENMIIDNSNSLRQHSDIAPGSYVMLSVSDTGCGMDGSVKEHIFEPFFTTKEVGKGTGLGLATVYGIVKQSNGYIDVQSEVGKGTRFRIYFPQIESEAAVNVKKQKTGIIPRGSETILLTEDKDSLRMMLQEFLHSIGYTVLPACNGKEALELAKLHKGKIHLLFTDVVMPGMNGFELSGEIKKMRPEIKLLFMSGYNEPSDSKTMMKFSNNFIQKPPNLETLSAKLREILD
ncbi:MAG: PAS domain S-box protein [Victivallales bacterium]|jgi:PAS domain S-box-containing protein